MSDYLQKIIYLTQSDYNTLASGDSVTKNGTTLTGLNDNYIYITDGKITLNDFDNSFILPVGKGGTGLSSVASGKILVGNGSNAFTTIDKATANTANTLVQRDASGNFSAGTITTTSTKMGNVVGSANQLINVLKLYPDNASNLLLAYKQSGTGVTTNQWMVGTVDIQGVIRSSNTDLLHSRNGTNSVILDVGNYKTYAYALDGSNTGTKLQISTQSAAYANGIQFMNSTTKKGSIGTDNNGTLGIYGTKVVLRPQLDNSTEGVEITTDAMYPTTSITLGTDSNKWSTVYATTFNGNATTATADENGYNLANHYAKRYEQIVDLTNLSTNTWYPVSVVVPRGGMHRISCITQLDGGNKPSWAAHQSGFTAVVEMLVLASGWRATNSNTICLCNDQRLINANEQVPVGYTQFINSSRAAFWCRGGAKYRLLTDFFQEWSIHTESYVYSDQTIAPTTTYPGFNFIYSEIMADLNGKAAKLTDITSSDIMGSSNTWRRIWASYADNTTGRPAYSDDFAYQSSTGTVKVGRISCWPSSGTNNFSEGIRIHQASNGWGAITFCGSDNLGDTGTSANSWGIFNNQGNFYISRNGSFQATTSLKCENNVWSWNGIAEGDISGTATYAKFPYSIFVSNISGKTLNANAPAYTLYSDYGGGGCVITNMPSGWHYGSLLTIGTNGAYNTFLSAQFAWDVIHNSANAGQLWFRTNGVGGGTNGWKNWARVWIQGDAITGAVWNDYAENRTAPTAQPGQVLTEVGDDTLIPTTERLQHFAGIVSDTWGFLQGETETAKTPIAVAGRVLAYPYRNRKEYKPGDPLCAAPGGTVDIMTREEVRDYPDKIVGTVSCVPDYEEWGGDKNDGRKPVKVNGRIWVKVK